MENKFKPLDLSKSVVNIIFNKSLTTTPDENSPVAVFHLQKLGYPEDSDPVFFDKQILDEHTKIIYYILGQLEKSHTMEQPILHPIDFFRKYTGENWTDDKVTVMKLIHLALATGAISQFSAKSDATGIVLSRVFPTLSPKDPNFEQWYEQNKVKILRKKGGQEPADD